MSLTVSSPGTARMIAVNDEKWAAPSLTSAVLTEGQEQGGLDFTLSKGTLVHGRVTEGPEHRPSPGCGCGARGGRRSPAEGAPHGIRQHVQTESNHPNRCPGSVSDPGRTRSIRAASVAPRQTREPLRIEVKDEVEIVRDLTRRAPAAVSKTFIKGVVVEKTATGERPVAGALAFRWPVRGSHRTDEEGKFLVERESGETIVYAYCPDKALAGFSRLLPANADNVKVVLSPTATVTGRVIDSNGKPRANQRVGVRLASGSASRFEFPGFRRHDRRPGPVHLQGCSGGIDGGDCCRASKRGFVRKRASHRRVVRGPRPGSNPGLRRDRTRGQAREVGREPRA